MKKCNRVSAWTDYPFVDLGDAAGMPAPIRHVIVLSYDQNKYAKSMCKGTT